MSYQHKFLSRRQTGSATGSPLHQPTSLSGSNTAVSGNGPDGVSNGYGLTRKGSRNYERDREREEERNERMSLPPSRKYSLTQAISNGSGGPNSGSYTYADLEDNSPAVAPFQHREPLLRRAQSIKTIERSGAALQRAGTLTSATLTPSGLSIDKQFVLNAFPQIDDRYLQLDFVNQEGLSKCTASDLLPHGSPDVTREFLGSLVTLLLNYVEMENDRTTKVLEFRHPKQLEQIIDIDIPDEEAPSNLYQLLLDCQQALQYQVRSGHPRFFNQISTGLDMVSLAGEWLTATANSNMFTYEVSPVFVLIEKAVLQRMRELVGWATGDGIFAPGGSISNLYAVHLARHKKFPQCKSKGMAAAGKKFVIFTSAHCHYSIASAASVLGFGSDNVVEVSVDDRGKMDLHELEKEVLACLDRGDEPLMVNATAGTTVLGSFDPISGIADICEKFDIWLHVDAAWGGGVLCSRQHRNLMLGVERKTVDSDKSKRMAATLVSGDFWKLESKESMEGVSEYRQNPDNHNHGANSITWNPHKMMGAHLQCSAILTRDANCLFSCNNMSADYLFQQDKHYNVEYDTGDKAIQCGRRNDVFKLWLMWRAKGTLGFEKHIDGLFELRDYLVRRLRELEDFELVFPNPECTNVCFWYVPPSSAHYTGSRRYERLGRITAIIKARMMDRGSLMVGYQPLDDKPNFFRMIISNQASVKGDIDFMLEEIVRIGHEL